MTALDQAVPEATEHAPETPSVAPDEDSFRLAEAMIFAAAEPVTARALAQVLPASIDTDAVIAGVRARFDGRGMELVEAGGGYMFRTAADLAPRLRKVVQVARRLPKAAMETLAIIAYHQPVTRPEIEDIRGASLSQNTLEALLEQELIVTRRRKEVPGRPALWETTPKFLTQFGLADLRALPRREDLLVEPVVTTEHPDTGEEEATEASGNQPG
jgi:segregation and condensation protein B